VRLQNKAARPGVYKTPAVYQGSLPLGRLYAGQETARRSSKLDPQISMRNINREVEKVEKGKKKKEKPWYFLLLSQILQITWI
jgi:hypothetical protein